MPPDEPSQRSPRRFDFDWLRIGALALLIVTHTAYVYRSLWWRTHSDHAGLWADLLIEALAPWRISIVFFIAGAATRFMLERHDLGGFLHNRTMRLAIPFTMTVIVLVPPMVYLTDPSLRGANYLDFLVHAGLHAREVYGVWVPDLAHVWFLPHILLYGLAASLAWRFARPAFEAACRRIAAAPVAVLVAGLAVCFIIADALLKPVFGRSNMLVDDPVSHVRAIPVFILGLALARPSEFWTRLRAAGSWLFPLAGLLVLAVLGVAAAQTPSPDPARLDGWAGLVDGAYGAVMVFAILGLASRFLARSGPGLSYFGDAIMPIYLMHQPVIIFVTEELRGAGLPLWAEFGLILGLAAGLPLVVYHFLIRPTPFLRIIFGLKAAVPQTRAPTAAPKPGLAAQPFGAASQPASAVQVTRRRKAGPWEQRRGPWK